MEYEEITPENITGAQLDTLIALVERGPLESGDTPSKTGRDELVLTGNAASCVVNMQQGYSVATYRGSALYCKIFGNSGTIREAKAFRDARAAIRRAQ